MILLKTNERVKKLIQNLNIDLCFMTFDQMTDAMDEILSLDPNIKFPWEK